MLKLLFLLLLAQDFPADKDMVLSRPFFLVFRADVREELKLSEKQWDRVLSLSEGIVYIRPERAVVTTYHETDLIALEKDALSTLTPSQTKRLEEIWIQTVGTLALCEAKIAKAVRISPKQAKEIETIILEAAKEIQALYKLPRDEPIAKRTQDVRNKAMTRSEAILTPRQREAVEGMKGKPFVFRTDKLARHRSYMSDKTYGVCLNLP